MNNFKNVLINRIRKNIVYGFSKRAGKNSFGRKTIFTQSGGYRLFYNFIDFKRFIPGLFMLLTIERNYIYTSNIGLVCYANGHFCYILLSEHLNVLNKLYLAFTNLMVRAPTFLYNIQAGNFVHHIEVVPAEGAKIMRSAGTTCFIISKENEFSYLKMKSGWMLKISDYCIAILGRMSNEVHFITNRGNAGTTRKLGFRPVVRGIAKNPCDHPHGGGEGRGSPPRIQQTAYGKNAKSPTKNKRFQRKKRFFLKIYKR